MKAIAPVVFGLLLLVGCNSGSGAAQSQVFCAKNPIGCRCANEQFTLEAGEEAVASCDDPAQECCYDVDANGQTTSCSCATYACFESPGGEECNCDYFSKPDTDKPRETCTQKDFYLCCEDAERNDPSRHACACNPNYTSCAIRGYTSHVRVEQCSPGSAIKRVCPGKGPAASCNGLVWKPPTPPEPPGDSGGGPKKECTNSSQCSSKCASDCYRCSAGDCQCGHRGAASGACIY